MYNSKNQTSFKRSKLSKTNPTENYQSKILFQTKINVNQEEIFLLTERNKDHTHIAI